MYNSVVLSLSPSFSLRSRPAERNKSGNPGPGQYNPNTEYVLENSPSATIPKSTEKYTSNHEKITKEMPGPGTYGNSSSSSGPKWGFGSSSRINEKDKKTPGPGAYNL